jgi:hypothetical protein
MTDPPKNTLALPLGAIAGVPQLGERTRMPLAGEHGEIGEGEGPLLAVAFGQGRCQLRLAAPSPIHGVLEGPGVCRGPPSVCPRLVKAVSGCQRRAVASFDCGSLSRATLMATTTSRWRLFCAAMRASKPSRRRVPRMATTWP